MCMCVCVHACVFIYKCACMFIDDREQSQCYLAMDFMMTIAIWLISNISSHTSPAHLIFIFNDSQYVL